MLLGQQFGGLGVYLFSFVLEAINFVARFLDLQFCLFFARDDRPEFTASLLDNLAQLASPLLERLLLLLEGSAHLFFRGQRDFVFGQAGVFAIPLQPQIFHLGSHLGYLNLSLLLEAIQRLCLVSQCGPFLLPFLLLRGQALNFVNYRLDFLVKQALRILEGLELAFTRGNGHFLRSEFGLGVFEAGLKVELLALQRSFADAQRGHLLLQLA